MAEHHREQNDASDTPGPSDPASRGEVGGKGGAPGDVELDRVEGPGTGAP